MLNPQTLEQKLQQRKDPMQRLALIDQLACHYAFTNVARARQLLEEEYRILRVFNYSDFKLNYHLNLATIENNLYHFAEAEKAFQKAIAVLEDMGTAKQVAEVYIDYAGTLMNLERMEEAMQYLDKAAKLLRNFPDQGLQSRITCREGFLQLHYADYPKAIELLLESKKLIASLDRPLELKDNYFLTLIYSGLGKIYDRNDEYEKSVQSYLKVVNMCENLQMRTRIAWHYVNVGTAYMALNDLENAELYFRKAINTRDDASRQARAGAFANLGFCYFYNERYKEALEHFDKAERLYKETSEEDYLNFSILELWRGRLYTELDQPDDALEHFAGAYAYASKIEDYKQLASICKYMASFYADDGDYKSAYEYQLLHDKFLEQYNLQLDKRQQAELEAKYEAAKKRQETELLRLEATRLQLKALRAQMNPHFMYNALNAIQSYITSNEVSSASKYLAKFAKLVRQSLDYSELEIIPLEQEIAFLEDYLHINEKLRFEDRLKYEIKVDDEIEEDILGVPTMIVQPYVENAIEHGLRTRKKGLIKVHFSMYDDDTILCVVEDNGIGREKAHQMQMQDPKFQNHRSMGTSITEKRLQILHNSKDKGVFVKTIDLKDAKTGEPKGTRVEIKIPIVDIR